MASSATTGTWQRGYLSFGLDAPQNYLAPVCRLPKGFQPIWAIKGVTQATSGEYLEPMGSDRKGDIAVIFASTRTEFDPDGYQQAAQAMAALAEHQPGYRGIMSTRGADGFGITVSYWADDAAAIAWRDHPEHTAIREQGRAHWYSSYSLDVARVERSYAWSKAPADG
jgi:heme-degrading monooxygenase HmoA